MKVLSFHELGIDDRLRLTLESSFSHHGNLEAALAPFIQTLEAQAGDWMPEIVRGSRNRKDKVHEMCWLNIFGPKLVETVGRERVLSTPAHRVEELPNGSVLLVLRPTAADFASDEARVAQARAHVHLRPDLDFDTVLRILRERSAALAPVEPRFHPDLTPLLSRLPDEVAFSERQREIAELNAFQPPEPEEWLPVALPPDVENPERYKRDLIDSHTAPALGGTWIPRQNPEESQVRVGQRLWLPFLRARRYMESRQSLLTHSLTQFFREAERHRS